MVYRAQARLRIDPASIRRFDPTQYYERINKVSMGGTAARIAAQQRAAQRKVEQENAAKVEQETRLKEIQDRIASRTATSQEKVRTFQNETVGHYQRLNTGLQQQNARLAQQRSRLQQITREQRLGASPSTTSNQNFRGGDGRLVAVGGTASKKAASIINEALKYRGKMYQWGGSTPQTSFDCSGLVQWAYKSVGVSVPRVSADQARYGRKVPLSHLRPGDLVAWDNSSRNVGADHIAIYIGNGQIIEAPRTGEQIRVRALGNENAWGVQILK